MLKLVVFIPNNEEVIERVIEKASLAGAGHIGNYSQCAFITLGKGHWKSEAGAHPTIGKVGKVSKEPEVKVEMLCPNEKAKKIQSAIQKVHPYEEPAIEFIQLVEI